MSEKAIAELFAFCLGIDTRPKNLTVVVDGTGELAHKYGGTVYDKETPKTWDWGQALCRERYGIGWSASEGFADHEKRHAKDVDQEDADIITKWLQGDLPDWMDLSLMRTLKRKAETAIGAARRT